MTRALAADDAGIAEAAAMLRDGRLVAFPTETVYGLGADATNERAVAAVFAAKGRPHFNPLIVHAATAGQAFSLGVADARAEALAHALWPGPLTLVLPCRPRSPVSLLARAGLDTVALRVPAHPVALALISEAGVPLAAPSANRSGAVSPTTAAHVHEGLAGRIDAVLDGGPCTVGIESSVLDLTGRVPVLLRPGGATVEAIEAVVGPVAPPIDPETAEGPRTLRSPGLLVSHYAPVLPVRLGAEAAAGDEALLAFGPEVPPAPLAFNLSEAGDLGEAAARLFCGLRLLDSQGRARGLVRIAAMPVPSTGLGLAINDRLKRAAAPR